MNCLSQASVGADLSACPRADKSAMGTINRPLHLHSKVSRNLKAALFRCYTKGTI